MDYSDRIAGPDFTAERSVADEALAWAGFANARFAAEFCQSWLNLQCRLIPGAIAGLLLLDDEDGSFAPAATWPAEGRDFTELVPTAERALRERRGIAERLTEDEAHAAYPVDVRGKLWGVVVVNLGACPDSALQDVLRRLHWGAGWVEALFHRRQADEDAKRLATARTALEMVAAVGAASGLVGAATALANELEVRLACRRVAVGVFRRGRVRVLALSHAANLARRLRLADSLANAMEEAIDQSASVAYPAHPGGERRVAIAHRDHVHEAKLGSALTFVLTARGRTLGAVTLERDSPAPFDQATVTLCEAIAAVAAPVIGLQRDVDRLFGGRLLRGLGRGWRVVFGPRHPAWKLGALAAAGLAGWLAVATGNFRISGKADIEGKVQRALVAPFDGFVASAPHRAGDVVRAGTVIATLDTHKMALDALRYRSQRAEARLKQRDDQGKHDIAAAEVQGARAAEAGAQLALEQDKIKRAQLTAPFRGLIVSGDLTQKLGSPVERGKVLFKIAPLDRYRVVVQVNERDIRFIRVGQPAALVLSGLPDRKFSFDVTRIVPVSVAEGGENTFRVEGTLHDDDPRLRPGMEGIGKITVSKAHLAWIWSRPIIDWVRLLWWKWAP